MNIKIEDFENLKIYINMPDDCTYEIPASAIAKNRAEYYAEKDGVGFSTSYEADTIPLFCSDTYEIEDWARNSMDWVDVIGVAKVVHSKPPKGGVAFQNAWLTECMAIKVSTDD